MATSYKILGTTVCTANTDTTLYVVPALTQAIVATICICNQAATNQTFRIAIIPGALGSVTSANYIVYDALIVANDAEAMTLGITMSAGDTILVRSDSADVSFNAYGSDIV